MSKTAQQIIQEGPSPVRDRFVWAVSNFLFRHVASDWYGGMISGAIRIGLQTAASDSPGYEVPGTAGWTLRPQNRPPGYRPGEQS